ncbi:MAG TPA: hypothetical protein VK179_01465 [Bacteroidales bacterium]|nr:hypothetical protein [Bacteroidales bacterium]
MRFVLFLLFLTTLDAYSQEKLNKFSVNPIQLIGYNRLNVEYERGFHDGKYGISIYYGQTGNSSRKIHGQYSYLSEQNASFRLYSRKLSVSSFWYGGMISVTSGNIYDENGIDKATNIGALGIMAVTGYQFIIKSFYATPYLGVGYALTNNLFGSVEYTGHIGRPTDWLLTYGLKTGFCF